MPGDSRLIIVLISRGARGAFQKGKRWQPPRETRTAVGASQRLAAQSQGASPKWEPVSEQRNSQLKLLSVLHHGQAPLLVPAVVLLVSSLPLGEGESPILGSEDGQTHDAHVGQRRWTAVMRHIDSQPREGAPHATQGHVEVSLRKRVN